MKLFIKNDVVTDSNGVSHRPALPFETVELEEDKGAWISALCLGTFGILLLFGAAVSVFVR